MANSEFWVGRDNSTLEAHLFINGGSVGTSEKRLGNLVLRCGNAKNSIELNSGWIYANTFRLAGGGGASTFNMTGGTLDVLYDFEIGRDSTQSIVNVSGGTVVARTLKLEDFNPNSDFGGGTLNIIGNKSDWTVGTIIGNTNGKLNFIAGHVNEDGSVEF
ncbi:MAG: hypothetical protein Q4C70_13610, partial [Planctomycetia bacterium]|nr:hypothetical protein [Planctomycetia bacterium]